MEIHASGEDYLKTRLILHKQQGTVRSVDVAQYMNVSKPSVCNAVSLLQEGQFLVVDEDYCLHLTGNGLKIAEEIYERHCFFKERLLATGVASLTTEKEACKMEHAISDESFQKLKNAISTK